MLSHHVVPSNKDILAGRSGEAFTHEGNVQLRQTCARLLNKYIKAPIRTQKSQIIRDVIKSITSQGGRFLKQNPETKQWYDTGFKEAKMRVSRTFRDAAVPNKVKCIERMSTGSEGPAKQLCDTPPLLIEDDEFSTSFEEQGSNISASSFVTEKRSSISLARRDSLTSLLGDGLLVNVFEDEEVNNELTRMPGEDFSSSIDEDCHYEVIVPPTSCLSRQALEEILHSDIGMLPVPQRAY